jgi:uncharacterized protein YfaS (alpha-2-macroglobulin family)
MTLLAAVACGGNKSEGDGESRGSGSGDGSPRRAAITPQQISPVVIHELGPDRSLPGSVVFELATPIFDRKWIGQPTPLGVVKITPEIQGATFYTGPAELTFTPRHPFEFDRTYEIELTGVPTDHGPIKSAAGEPWSYSFKTPTFQFLGWAPSDIDLAHHKITMDLAFTGPVLPNTAYAAMAFSVDGVPVAGIAPLPDNDASHVTFALTDPKIALGAKLAVAIKRGVASSSGVQGDAAQADYAISNDQAVSIKAAVIVEGASGYYLEVVCNDSAADKGDRTFFDHQSFEGLSKRCQLTDDAIKHIHFEPAVARTYITAGSAGFRVFGEFKRGIYKVTIDGGASSLDGGVVLAPFTRQISVGARRPQLSFAGTGRYLPRSAWTHLGIKHTNVDTANLVVRQIPMENLVFWLGEDSDAATERTSDTILKKQIPLRGAPDTHATTWLDVADLLPATTKGVLEMKLTGPATAATARLLLTNLSLVAKKSTAPDKPAEQTVRVWALDMDSADLLSGVDVSLVRKSGKVVATCTTKGGDGCTLVARTDADPDDAVPFALIARNGDDVTYLRYEDLRAEVAESSTSGAPYVTAAPYRAAVYADRGVYRPGDTAHVVAIVRDARDRAPDQPLPVDVQIIDPRTKIARKLALKTNAAGVIAFDQAFAAFADTGHWRVALTVADKPVASENLEVEEFVPERMRVTATAVQAELVTGQPASFNISAQYLFGGSAAGSGVEMTCEVRPVKFEPVDHGDLTYGIAPRGKPVSLGEARTQLDPAGNTALACPEPEGGTPFTGTAQVTGSTAVLEAGSGRATTVTATAMWHPERYYLGLRSKSSRAVAGEPIRIEGMVVDWAGKLAPAATGQVHIELAHLESDYGYGEAEGDGESHFDRWLRPVPEGKLDAKVSGGVFSFDVTPGDSGTGFVIRVTAGKATTELVLDGESPYEYRGDGEDEHVDQTPRPAKPTQLAVKLAAGEIKVGEAASVAIRSPYRGKVLWTVETDRVVTAEWKDLAAGEATWSFTLDKFAPNVYVSAFVVKDPHLESKDAFLPDRAFGVASARVAPTELTQTVQLAAPKAVRSSSPLTISLAIGKTFGPAFATVAVVDEGILSLTRFATPDPLAELFGQRALGVETYETIGWTMLHQPAGASSRTGGGDEGEADGAAEGALGQSRVQPVKPVALFSGVVAIGADGKLTIPFQVPQYRGQLRVMAVVATPTRIGRAEAEVTVKDPLVVQATFPRFVTQNDALEIPVFLTNTSPGPLEVSVALTSETLAIPGLAAPRSPGAPFAITGKDAGTIKIAAGFSETVVFQAKAVLAVGGARLQVVARARGPAGAFEAKDEASVPFLPAGPRDRVIEKWQLEAGRLDLTAKSAALKNWLATSETSSFWITNNPYGEVFQHLGYLVHYPYGCIEQTASSTRPLLYVANLVEQVDPGLAELKIEDMVLAGINRMFSMETPSGGFGYWPGSTEPLEWATAYATDTLLDARQRGYGVPEDRLNSVLAWIEGRVSAYERGEKIVHAKWNFYDEQSEAYLHYVLARAGKAKKARILALISKVPGNARGEQLEDLYLLKAALHLAGDRRYDRELKAPDTSPIAGDRVNSYSFYSDRRRRGLMLSTFFDLFGKDPAGELLATRVAESLSARPSAYYNTQELVWGITGLGKWIGAPTGHATPAGTLIADGTKLAPRGAKHKSDDVAWSVVRAGEYKQLTLDIPAQAAGAWLVIASEGVHANATYQVGGNGLAIDRTYDNLAGEQIDPASGELKLGDLVVIELSITNTTGAEIDNIAVIDRLPAGFEIENPRLGRSTKPAWIVDDEQWDTEFLGMRDDHLEAFGRLAPKAVKKLVYTARVVTSGKFTIPPVEAQAMYDPTLWSRQDGGTAIVTGPWTGKLL